MSRAFDVSFDRRGEMSVFEGPGLIVAGRQDSMSGYLGAIDLLPGLPRATLAVLESAGPWLAWWERPEVFGALLRDRLERLTSAER